METCSKDHSGDVPASLNSLPRSQAKSHGRHKCAACAYELGRKDAGEAEARLRIRVKELSDENARLKEENARLEKMRREQH
jgi:hypothetical protein